MQVRIHRFTPFTRVEGPGNRACLWVQGCPIRCAGCFNPETWSFDGGSMMEVEELATLIYEAENIEGVTFLGGEPFEQAEALAELGRRVKDAGLSVMTFTGYVYEDIIESKREEWSELLDTTDLLVDGPYIKELTDTSRPWVGSSNQRYRFLSSRYGHLSNELQEIPNRLEVKITPQGEVLVNGLATAELLNDFLRRT